MSGVWRAFMAERRRRWASWLALSLLVALVGGTVLAGVVAARRTASAFPSFVARYGADAAVFESGAPPTAAELRGTGAHLFAQIPAIVNGNVRIGSNFLPSEVFSLFARGGTGEGRAIKLLSGRWPTRRNEVDAGFSLQQLADLHVGSVISVPLYARSQSEAVLFSNGNVPTRGPVERFHVVGFVVSMLDFPTATPSYTLLASHAFFASTRTRVVDASIGLYRLSSGSAGIPRFNFAVNHVTTHGVLSPYPFDAQESTIESSIHPQVVGWWLFALLAGIAGLALIGQALARQAVVERESFPTLSALGLTPSQLSGLGMLRAGAIGLVGAAGAVVLAYLLSPLTPVGEARAAAAVQGFDADVVVLGIGALAIVAIVAALAAYPSWRAGRARDLARQDRAVRRPSRVAGVLARVGAPPFVLIGVRHALERGRGRSSVPVATALLGAVAAVTAICATSVFGASLTTLLDTPALYGQSWQVEIGSLNWQQMHKSVASITRMPGVGAVSYGVSNKEVTINGVETNLLAFSSAKGPVVLTSTSGRFPKALGQADLGSQTLAEARSRVGGVVRLAVIAPNGHTTTSPVRVAGTTIFPPVLSGGADGLGDGVAVPLPEIASFFCGTSSPSSPCVQGLDAKLHSPAFEYWGIAVRIAPTPAGRHAEALIEQTYSQDLDVVTAPTNLVNFGQAVNFPLLLGAMLALFGAATLVHLLLVSVVRRRRELALLKVLGSLRRQAASAVCWQSVTVVVVGLVAGVPLGIAVGHVVWRGFAAIVGVVPRAVVPVGVLTLVGAGAVVSGLAFALVPAVVAARLRPAEALHEQ